MTTQLFKHVPWTCHWGRFGVTVEQASAGARGDGVFWGCHQPVRAPDVSLARRGECEECPFWELTPRFRAH